MWYRYDQGLFLYWIVFQRELELIQGGLNEVCLMKGRLSYLWVGLRGQIRYFEVFQDMQQRDVEGIVFLQFRDIESWEI